MSRLVPESELPVDLTPFAAVEAAYPDELQRACDALHRGLPVLVECDKGLVPYFYRCLRDRLKALELRCEYLDGRSPPTAEPQPATNENAGGLAVGGRGVLATIIRQLRQAVRGAVDRRVVVLPHLDLLTSTSGGLTAEAREVIPLMYENPQLLWLGFRDPSFPVPRVVHDLFPHRFPIVGVPRERLRFLVTARESRKLGRDGLDVYRLYKSVSGVHAARLRQLLSTLEGEDYPGDARPAWDQLRAATLEDDLDLPDLDLRRDIGGYPRVKERIQRDILDVVARKETLEDPAAIERVESLVPRGLVFWGPPGTGKTLFAKAMATALGAAVQVVSGPELKSRWVGESEENLRRVFTRARRSAPSVIVFDELDSFAGARGTWTGSGVEHSMVNQLLTEMDGFRSNETVFVVGTTNFPESLDPALLRPGRFELRLAIPWPDADDRREILSIYDRRLDLRLEDRALEHAVRQTAAPLPDGGRWTGDHLQALCRTIARQRLRDGAEGPTDVLAVDAALVADLERPVLTSAEETVVATHEAGHAIVALACEHVPSIDRISIRGDLAGSLGFVRTADPVHRHVVNRGALRDGICVLYGGREAELELLDDLSVGSAHDLSRATEMARRLVESYGMGPEDLGIRDFASRDAEGGNGRLADATRAEVDRAVVGILEEERGRARRILAERRPELVALRDLLLEKKVLEAPALVGLGS